MALVDGRVAFATQLITAMKMRVDVPTQAAANMAQAFAALFAYATLDGIDIALGSNLAQPALDALILGLTEAYSVKDDAQTSAQLIEDAILAYLNEAPIVDMWAAAVEATKDGPDLYDIMTDLLDGYENSNVVSKVRVADGIIQWVNESVKVELDEVPARYEYIV